MGNLNQFWRNALLTPTKPGQGRAASAALQTKPVQNVNLPRPNVPLASNNVTCAINQLHVKQTGTFPNARVQEMINKSALLSADRTPSHSRNDQHWDMEATTTMLKAAADG